MAAAPERAAAASFTVRWSPGAPPRAFGDAGPGPSLPTSGPAVCLWSAGFIANRRELLARTGAPGETGDAALLLRLYETVGDRAADAVAGPFAWSVWDPERRLLIAARDRQGVTAPVYAERGGGLWLASSVEALLDRLGRPPALSRPAMAAHLAGQGPAEGETFYEGVAALEPGQLLRAEGARVAGTRRYWRIEPRPVRRASDAEHAEALRELLFRVVREYLPAAPVGVTLSGGLDSTSVTAALVDAAPDRKPVPFVWTAPELPEADERARALIVSSRSALRPVEIRADLLWPLRGRGRPPTTRADPLATSFDEAWTATFQAAAERGLRVLFTGASGDNLFGGNVFSYPDLLLTGRWVELLRQLREHLPRSERGVAGVLRAMVLAPIARAYLPRRRPAPPPDWLAEECREGLPAEEPPPYWMLPGRKQHLRQMRERILPRMMAHMSRRAAEHGIELRNPLLDHRLFDFACSLPSSQLFRAAVRKVVVRNAMRPYLPPEVVDCRGKVYPAAIFERGLRERETAKVEALLTGMRAAELGLVDEDRLRAAYRDYRAGTDRSARFWHALTLESWLREHFA